MTHQGCRTGGGVRRLSTSWTRVGVSLVVAFAVVLTGCASVGRSQTRVTAQAPATAPFTMERPAPAAQVQSAAIDDASTRARWFRVSWEPRTDGGAPTIGGWVYNDSAIRVTNVRLRVEGLDTARNTVGETTAWPNGAIAPRDRTYFVAPTLPGATTYRISVVSFDAVSFGDSPPAASPASRFSDFGSSAPHDFGSQGP